MNKFIFLVSLLFFFNCKTIFASHAMGGDLTYRCLGINQYEITFTFYRDCAGIDAPDSMSIDIMSSCFVNLPTIFLLPTTNSPTQISPLCFMDTSTCFGGSYTGVEEWIYTGEVTLPGPCSDWTFSHSESARNAAITTITGSGSDNLFVYSTLNNLNGICNNSPVFNNKPVIFACVNQQSCFNNAAFDVDGDSLTFQFITPRTGPLLSDTVNFISPYSTMQPLVLNQPMHFDTLSGEICFVSIQPDVTVMALLVNEFRNGILIGQVERDIQLTVMPCNNHLPFLNGISGHSYYHDVVCANENTCLVISALDPDTANNTTISWNQGIPNMTFVHSSAHHDIGNFCWTPTIADISSNPHCFIATVTDDNCPYYGIQSYSYCLTVDSGAFCFPLQIESPDLNLNSINIFPQPANDYLNIDLGFEINKENEYQLRITDILGINIYSSIIKNRLTIVDLRNFKENFLIFNIFDKNNRLLKSEKILIAKY